jgi:hypothetical protein
MLWEKAMSYHWVKFDGRWVIAERIDDREVDVVWRMFGTDESFDEDDFDEIGDEITCLYEG